MTFDIDTMLAEAGKRSGGLSDFGEPSFRPALQALLAALDGEGKLSEMGRLILNERIIDLLNEGIEQTRSVTHGLHPVESEPAGLMAALQELANSVGICSFAPLTGRVEAASSLFQAA